MSTDVPIAELTPPSRTSWFDRRTARVIVTGLLFTAVGAFVYAAWRIIVVFLFAIFLAYLLAPLVNWVERRKKRSRGSRTWAILWVYLALAILIAVLIIVAGPRLISEGRRLSTDLPNLMANLTSGKIAWQIGSKRGWSLETSQHLQHFLADHSGQIESWARDFGAYAARFVADAVWIVLIPILSIFFLKSGAEIAENVVCSVERRGQRRFVRGMVSDVNEMLAHYIRAQLILAALSILAYTAVLSLIRLPYAVVLGVLSGVLEFIPVVGPLAAAAVDLGVGFLTNFHHLVPLILFLIVWRVIQDYVNSPRIMGGKLEIHPLAVLFGVLAGAEVGGVIGVYLSIPVIAILRIFWVRYRAYEQGASGDTSALTAKDEQTG